ncbi:MAG: phage portal protein [Lachnospiraceae bacterium]|nr:phage portal protein [Lachnospiraceae bacterium]
MAITERLRHAWDAFRNRDPTRVNTYHYGESNYRNPSKADLRYGNDQSIIASIYNRIAIDCASISIQHVRLDQNGRYTENIDDSLNQRLTISPNLDQTPRSFLQDIYLSLFEDGYVAIVPVDADHDPTETGTFEFFELRRGRIVEWFPEYVRVECYNQKTGRREELIMPKKITAIIENPFYAVMNGPNSTLRRLSQKLNYLDAIDQQSASGKMDLIVQLPYTIKTDVRREQAEQRRKDIEVQLTGSKYGIAYMDATERITQLNRPLENNLLAQVEYLTKELYTRLGLTVGIFDGTASEQEKLWYNNGTIEPIVSAVTDELKRKFLTKTARTQGQSVMFFRDPFKLVPVSQIAEIADKFTRNEILSSNEVRAIMGFRPSDDPKADELRNSNIAASKQELESDAKTPPTDDELAQE